MDFQTIIGTVGVTLLLVAYFLQLIKKISSDSKIYALLNIIGSLLSAYSSYLIAFVPFIVLELTWALVSVIALVKAFSKEKAA